MTPKRALVCGVAGQDGAYLAKLLLEKGYQVWGTSRDAAMSQFENLAALHIRDRVQLRSMAINDFRSVLNVMFDMQPDEVYLLAAQSSVGLSFDQPADTLESIAIGVLNVLEIIRLLRQPVRLYHASSSECFGETGRRAANESTPFAPRSPYAVAKASAHWLTRTYREAYGLFACNGILFNHESPLRPMRFVTRKIISSAVRIAAGSSDRLKLGRVDIVRDWGWAPEYVEAMWRMLQQEKPGDFVIATGHPYSLEDFVRTAFEAVGLDWRDYVDLDTTLHRPADIDWSEGDASHARGQLGWQATMFMPAIVQSMVDSERKRIWGEGVR